MKQWSSLEWTKTKDADGASQSAGRPLGFWNLMAMGLGSSVGFGVSVLVGHLLRSVAGPALVVSVSLAGVAALVGGLCFAEFGVRLLKLESAYGYCYLWGKESVAFLFGWVLILQHVAGVASGAKGVVAFIDSLTGYQISDFLQTVTSLDPDGAFPYFDFISLGIVAVLTVLIASGMKDSLGVRKALTAGSVFLIVAIVTAGAFKADPKNWGVETPTEESEFGFTPFGVLGVAKGAALAFYGFIGFDTVSIAEAQKRKRNLPLAIVATVVFTLAAFAGVAVVLTLMLPYDEHDPYAAVPFAFQQMGWIALKWIVVVASFLGFQNSLFGAAFPLPRIIFAMANDGLLFHCLGNRHSKLGIPVAASVTGGLASAVAAGFVSFEKLASLAVMGALLVFTTLAINVVLLRYTPKPESAEENLSESWSQLINTNSDVSLKEVVRNYFNFSAKTPTNLTRKIILTNLILFCVSSIGVGVIFNLFHEPLMACALEAVIPAGLFLSLLCLNLVSMTCQPTSRESAPFKVPLVPFLPCLSVFLNIFLLLTFEPLVWIFFFCWMILGIVPYSMWRCLKCFKEELGENSLYEINKSNAVKLSDSIWKIKSQKKSFYEGAINPVFSDDLDDSVKAPGVGGEPTKGNERTTAALNRIDVIQRADLVEEEKAKPLGNELELNFMYAEGGEGRMMQEDERVQWECIAEIHTEDELPQENVALEIVDNTYNFLSELVRDDVLRSSDTSRGRSEESGRSPSGRSSPENKFLEGGGGSEGSSGSPVLEKSDFPKEKHLILKEELASKLRSRMRNKENDSAHTEHDEEMSDREPDGQTKQNEETQASDDKVDEPPQLEEQNKVKQFKEKLNQLLKNQINGGPVLTKNSPFSKANVAVDSDGDGDADATDENDNNVLRNTVKTLNKSQIKSRLELLLTKGPPKRPSLGSSFNIKIKETDPDAPDSQNGGENTDKVTSPPQAEKIIPLENKELLNDVCC